MANSSGIKLPNSDEHNWFNTTNNNTSTPPKLRLNYFKELATAFPSSPPWLQFLVLSLLYVVEEWYINRHIKDTVSDAIENYKQQEVLDGVMDWKRDAVVVVTENTDSASQLPTLSIHAPYLRE
jgi:hypothetical protein